jgi:hypothetical protein
MKNLYTFIILIVFRTSLFAQADRLMETSDIPLFWKVYDKVAPMKDSAAAIKLIQEEYLDKGSPGLSAIKNFVPFDSRDMYRTIKARQLYLNSVRKATFDVRDNNTAYKKIFDEFKKLYPAYNYPKVYCTIGNMLIGGFNRDESSVVVGVELAAGTKNANTTSLISYLKLFVNGNPGVRYLLTHEIVHTQQIHGYPQNMNLTGLCLMEGSADFIADIVLRRKNTMPYTLYGQRNYSMVRRSFIRDKQKNDQATFNQWLYNTILYVSGKSKNKPDLGYFIGYKVCESYYNLAADKNQAIADILHINYDDVNSVTRFYNDSGFE